MAKRFDVLSPRPKKDSDKPYWHRVGTAWQGDRGINIVFDSLPLPDVEGRVSVSLFEPREGGAGNSSNRSQSGGNQRNTGGAGGWDDIDDEVPFR